MHGLKNELIYDNKDDKEDSSNESDSNNDAVGENNASQKPMIEMNVALGNFDSNCVDVQAVRDWHCRSLVAVGEIIVK